MSGATHDAILALGPNHMWSFATAPGDLQVNDEVGTLHFTSAVNDGGGITGPEIGVTSQRLFSDQIWTTNALNSSGWPTQAWMLLTSAPANASPSSYVPFFGWGDPSNRLNHGWSAQIFSASLNNLTFNVTTPSVSFGTRNIAYPQLGWHLWWWQINGSPLTYQFNVDTFTASPTSMVNANPLLATDKLWIQSSTPILISYLASFTQTLTQQQFTNVAQTMVQWPLQIPVNMPIQAGSSTVDLTPVLTQTTAILNNQAALTPTVTDTHTVVGQIQTQVNTLQTDVGNIINSLFPQLADAINDILGGITGTITTAAGNAAMTIGQWLSQHSHDQWGVFSVTGGTTCEDIHWPAGGTAYFGCAVQIDSYPTEWTFTTPADDWSIRDLAVITFKIGDELVGRHGVHTLEMEFPQMPGALPAAAAGIGVDILPPGYVIDVYWAGGVCGQLLLYYWP